MGLKMKVKMAVLILVMAVLLLPGGSHGLPLEQQALAVVLLLLPGGSHALRDQQKALVGLNGLCVMVSPIDTVGLTQEQIKTDIELQLRKAGIRVLTIKESMVTKGVPSLVAEVTAHQIDSMGFAVYSINVDLLENVTLVRGPSASAITWHKQLIGTIGVKNTREIRKEFRLITYGYVLRIHSITYINEEDGNMNKETLAA